ncbi:MAG: tetratricopeptide repeat protein, partial [Bacteroidales bacterium]|nr:tetratricopeptide repeat protein [Bacteroidales bacterium]
TEYCLGFLADASGDTQAASQWFAKAEALCTDYVFPFRKETAQVLAKALEYMPESANTWYYLGNLLYQKQPDQAVSCWEKAVEVDPGFAMALRNIGWYWRFKDEYHAKDASDYEKSLAYYRRAIAADTDRRAIFLTEADEVMERLDTPLQERYDLFMTHSATAGLRYDSKVRKIRQMMLHGDYEEALELLLGDTYSRREHIDDLHDIYVDACLLAGFRAQAAGDAQAALEYMLMAAEYPENQFYGHLEYYARDAQVYYNIGLAYENAGDAENARRYYGMAAEVEVKPKDAVYNYEKGLALRKLDPKAPVRDLYKGIVEAGKGAVTDQVQNFFESFDRGPYEDDVNTAAYYVQGIGYKALGREGKARRLFKKALAERNDNLWANYYLGNLK